MKTSNYNPSIFEVQLASAIKACKDQIEQKLGNDSRILEIDDRIQRDNPMVIFQLEDKDGDRHEVVVKIIQRPDKL